MKTVRVFRDFTYRAKRNVHIQYQGGVIHIRVTERATREIVAAGAGEVVEVETVEAAE